MKTATAGFVVVIVALGAVVACAPSRPSMIDPVQLQVRDRLGVDAPWREETMSGEEIDSATRKLLASELTEDAAARIALLRNRDLQAAYESLGVSEAALVQAGLPPNPVVDGSVRFTQESTGPNFGVGIEEDFLSLLTLPARVSVAEANVAATRAQVTARVIDTGAEARLAFVDAVSALQMQELRSTIAEAAEASWDLAKRLHDAGNINALQWAREESRYKDSVLALADAEREARLARERLSAALGLFGDETMYKLPARLPDAKLDDKLVDHLEARAVEKSLALQAMRSRMDALAHRLGYQNAARFVPSIDLGVELERDDGDYELGPKGAITLPLFNVGQGQVLATASELRMRGEELAAAAVRLRARARQVMIRGKNADERARFLKNDILPVRERVVEEATKNYNAMALTTFELLEAKRDQIEAASDYVSTLRQLYRARIEAERLGHGGGGVAMSLGSGAEGEQE